ncbi:tRNA (guanosine(37)-N1)-methyltransferase TrmD [Falsiroseomonas sp.]|uniref:tRNA (guanosine(37)-N1)-methyltransferase TrmD n=1 Tax=Falsiroseomonas sp. TaxID=2870721 RepID=UPI00272691F7|nr:tRNA (guanosine(37)-N1)-methyltransferase TrmD [Falsiroseomonas sp.]MDO9498728.1 tRNA (guanosine(37)-N1)-methyltransferase TrmD [Falsiroseomonas sp.]
MTWQATILTLVPEMFPGPLGLSLAGKALREGRWAIEAMDIRGFATDRHRTVDDTPFGGGAGMVMRPDVLDAACEAATAANPGAPLVYLTPRGRLLDQALVRDLSAGPGVVVLCGRYEGVDQRVIEARKMVEISAGDFVLSGGEPAALLLLDACIRLLPGVMGGAASAAEESHGADGLLEYPHYTRPAEWQGHRVPDVLLSGHHAEVARWRRAEAEAATRARRPDLWDQFTRRKAEQPNTAKAGRLDGHPAAA